MLGQVKAGAQMLQVFDSWGGELPPDQFLVFSLPYLKQIATQVKQKCEKAGIKAAPMTVFAKGAHHAFEDLLDSDYDVLAVDWTMEIRSVQKRVITWMDEDKVNRRQHVALQGNLDPIMLFAPPETLRAATETVVKTFLLDESGGNIDSRLSYVCNLGHGILPETPIDNVRLFLETVGSASKEILARK